MNLYDVHLKASLELAEVGQLLGVNVWITDLREAWRRGFTKRRTLMSLFHCMIRHGTVRYGSLLGGFPLGTVPGTCKQVDRELRPGRHSGRQSRTNKH